MLVGQKRVCIEYIICIFLCTEVLFFLTEVVSFLPACSIVSEMVIFLFLGISLFDNAVHKWDTGLVLFTLLFAAIFRPIGMNIIR